MYFVHLQNRVCHWLKQERSIKLPILELSPRQASFALVLLIAISTVGFSLLAYLKYARFNWQTEDTALFGYAFNQTLHGKFFPCYNNAASTFGAHPNFLFFLCLPVFWLVPTIYCLFLIQSFALSLAAWPVYLLARDKTGSHLTGLIAAAGALLFPPIAAAHVRQIQQDQFGLAILLFAVYFFEKETFKKFALCMAASLLAKETFALATAFFGLYALVKRRNWKWVVFPIGWSAGYLLLVIKVLLPLCGTWGTDLYSKMTYFSQYGNSLGEVSRYFTSNPLRLVGILFGQDGLRYLVQLLLPLLLVLPFGSWAWLLAAPLTLVNLLSSNHFLRAVSWHYSLIPGGLFWCSFICSLPFWNRVLGTRFGVRDYARGLCLITLLIGAARCDLWLHLDQYVRSPAHQARLEAVNIIPSNASVFCPENMLAHYVRHPAINSLHDLLYYERDLNDLFDYDYVVFDMNFFTYSEMQKQLLTFISGHPAYRSVYENDGVFVFKRIGMPQRVLRLEPATPP
ncbi:MAG: DUF2079 domain-containing protein [Verrucomicrobiia bacterium]